MRNSTRRKRDSERFPPEVDAVEAANHAPVGIRIVGADGTIVWANPTDHAMLGYARDEHVGRRMHELCAETEQVLTALSSGEAVQEREVHLRAADGTTRVGRASVIATFDAVGRLARSHWVTRLEVPTAVFGALRTGLEHASEGVLVVDEAWDITYANQRAATILRTSVAGLLGRRLPLLDSSPAASDIALVMNELVDGATSLKLRNVAQDDVRAYDGELVRVPGGVVILLREAAGDATITDSAVRRRLRAVDRGPVGFVLTTPEGDIVDVNDVFADLVGRPSVDLIGTSWFALTHEDDRDLDRLKTRELRTAQITSYAIPKRLVRRDGSQRWVKATARSVSDDQDRAFHSIVVEDIDDRRRTGEHRRSQERVMVGLFEDAPVAVLRFASGDVCTYSNAEWQRLAGLSPAETLGDGWRRAIHPEDVEDATALWRTSRLDEPASRELRLLRPDGAARWVLVRLRDYRELGERLAIVTDITERIVDEAAHARLAAVVDSSRDALFVVDLDGTIETWNPGAVRVFGLGAADVIHQPLDRLCAPDRTGALNQAFAQAVAGETTSLALTYRRGDEVADAELTLAPILNRHGEVAAVSAAARDVTRRRRAELELERRATIIDNLHDAVVTLSMDGVVRSWNRGAERLCGYGRDEAIGHDLSMISFDGAPLLDASAIAAMAATDDYTDDVRIRHRDGSERWVRVSCTLLRDPDGRPESVVAIAADITARRHAERALRISEERLRLLVDSVAMFTWSAPADFFLHDDNSDWTSITGQASTAGHGYGWASAVHEEDREALLADLAELMQHPRPFDRETRIVREDGEVLTVRSLAVPLFDDDGRLREWYGVNLDLTEHRKLEIERERLLGELQHTLKLYDIFVGILGHDLRTPLAAVLGSAEVALELAAGTPIERNLQRIQRSGRKMDRMISQILDVTRLRSGGGLQLNVTPADLEDICRDSVNELKETTSKRHVDVVVQGNTRGVWDRDRLAQVAQNLIANAAQHSDQGGITVVIDGSEAARVLFSVHNAGAIAKKEVAKIFEPFARGANSRPGGLGLGLFICREIARAHGGDITLESNAAAGTTFRVVLPREKEVLR